MTASPTKASQQVRREAAKHLETSLPKVLRALGMEEAADWFENNHLYNHPEQVRKTLQQLTSFLNDEDNIGRFTSSQALVNPLFHCIKITEALGDTLDLADDDPETMEVMVDGIDDHLGRTFPPETHAGRGRLHVNEYVVSLGYGGPEEGGWHYNVHTFMRCHGITKTMLAAEVVREMFQERADKLQKGEPRLSSLRSRDYIQVLIEEHAGASRPTHRPTYE